MNPMAEKKKKSKKKTYKYRHRETYRGFDVDVKADSTGDLAEKIRKRKAAIDRRTVSGSTKLQAFGDQYLETYKRRTVSASWYADMEMILEKKIVAGIGNRSMDKIHVMDVQAMLNGCSDLSDSYIKKIYDLTKQLFHQAYKNGITAFDISTDLVRPHGVKGRSGRALTDQEIDALYAACAGTPDELFLRIILQCGLRPGEVSALTWRDVDLDAGTISVNKAVKKDQSVGLPKSDAGIRTVPIPADLLQLMSDSSGSPFALVCPKQSGGYHTKSSLRKLWDRTVAGMIRQQRPEDGADGPRVVLKTETDPPRLYDLRHTYCTNLEKAGVPINIACRLMGHSDISVTSKIYTHASEAALEMARDLINGAASQNGKRDSDGKEAM